MQQLEERNTYTPTDIPHVSGNCDLSLNREETLSVIDLKTSSNNSDASLIATEHAKQNLSVSAVYVLNMRGQPLMPTTPGKAKKLLKEGKAKVVNRKTWYRQPRFLNRKKPEGWLAPSIQHKLDSHIKIINKVKELLPITKIVIEVAAFDIQKIKNPEISGIEYQNGVQKDSWNVREYVLHRDNHTCQACKGKSKDKILGTHHLISRQIGGDSPDNLLTLCETCHDKVTRKKLILDVKIPDGFKPETFMSIVRWKLVNKLRDAGNIVTHTYGYITKFDRIALGLDKSHNTDAFVIAGGTMQERNSLNFIIQQVRKCNRKLFKGDRSHIKNTTARIINGFQRFDKVLWNNIECFVFGRRKTGYFELRTLDGTKVHASAKAKELTLLETANTFLIATLKRGTLFHTLKSVVSATPAPHGVL